MVTRILQNTARTAFTVLILATVMFALDPAADLIIVNADVRTMDPQRPRAAALAIRGNLVVAVGTTPEIERLAGPKTKTIDAGGRLVLPGFNDSHVHFMATGNQFSSINLRNVGSLDQFAEKISYYLKFIPKGRWILGGYWDHSGWAPPVPPTREMLDELAPDNPVFLYNSSPETAVANSAALRLAGFDRPGKTVRNGVIERGPNGEPTGIVRGEAVRYLKAFTPRLSTSDARMAAITATNYAAYYGVTSVQDVHSDDNTALFRELESEGLLKTRIYDCITLPNRRRLIDAGIKRADGDAMIRRGCLKHYSDGDFAITDELVRDVAEADDAGLQVMIHAIGSRANDVVLTVYEQVLKRNGAKDRRFRIEHTHNLEKSDIPRLKATRTIASMQPYLFFGGAFYGGEPYRSLLDAGVPLAFGSDASITEINPLLGIYAAVNHRRASGAAAGETISVGEAVYAYTAGAAFAEFQENVKGTLTAGKLADIVILSDNIFEIDPAAIRDVRVLTTIVDGRVVFAAR